MAASVEASVLAERSPPAQPRQKLSGYRVKECPRSFRRLNNQRHHSGIVAGTSEEGALLDEDEKTHDGGSASPFLICASGKAMIADTRACGTL